MRKQGKKYNEALQKIEKGKLYAKEDAVKLIKETSTSKFDATVEVAMRLNLDTKKSDQQLRGAIVLPNGTGKSKKVLVVAKVSEIPSKSLSIIDSLVPVLLLALYLDSI